MSTATMVLAILFAINLGIFIYSWNDPNGCLACSPLLGIVSGLLKPSGEFDWVHFFSSNWSMLLISGGVAAAVWVIAKSNIGGSLTGSTFWTSTFGIISIGLFISLCGLPNFSMLLSGSPAIVTIIINIFFGFAIVLSVFGLISGRD